MGAMTCVHSGSELSSADARIRNGSRAWRCRRGCPRTRKPTGNLGIVFLVIDIKRAMKLCPKHAIPPLLCILPLPVAAVGTELPSSWKVVEGCAFPQKLVAITQRARRT